jgi:hypothetical protein
VHSAGSCIATGQSIPSDRLGIASLVPVTCDNRFCFDLASGIALDSVLELRSETPCLPIMPHHAKSDPLGSRPKSCPRLRVAESAWFPQAFLHKDTAHHAWHLVARSEGTRARWWSSVQFSQHCIHDLACRTGKFSTCDSAYPPRPSPLDSFPFLHDASAALSSPNPSLASSHPDPFSPTSAPHPTSPEPTSPTCRE